MKYYVITVPERHRQTDGHGQTVDTRHTVA